VYLSNEDDKEWQGDKRRGLEQGLFHVLSERAHELSGQTQLAAKSFAVELRVEGTLNKGQFRVQAVWVETERRQTVVNPRRDQRLTQSEFNMLQMSSEVAEVVEGEQTVVRARPSILYQVEIWRNGVREAVVPILKNEITIGRGSRSIAVDLPIKGDPEVSRVHATLALANERRYYLTANGRNPTLVNGQQIPRP